ncbi:MAG: response regulator transcription factor [Planctomycetaceae bacterium]
MRGEPTIFVVDDEQLARSSICAVIDSMHMRHEAFSSAGEFLQCYEPSRAGCLVTDVRMQDSSGLELQRTLAERGGELPVIVVSAYANVRAAVKAIKQGAVTFLQKPFNDHELFEAICEALEEDRETRARAERRRDLQGRIESLTPEERQVMDLIVEGKPNKAVAGELKIGLRTVESRKHMVFEKMQADSLAALVRLILEARSRG